MRYLQIKTFINGNTFNIRSWLTKLNDAALTDSKDLFGFELAYEKTSSN